MSEHTQKAATTLIDLGDMVVVGETPTANIVMQRIALAATWAFVGFVVAFERTVDLAIESWQRKTD